MADSPDKPAKDVLLAYRRTDDGKGACVLRARDGQLEAGEVRALADGACVRGAEVVTLRPRAESPLLYDVDVKYDAREKSRHGPARVTSRAYRSNFDQVFAKDTSEDDPAVN